MYGLHLLPTYENRTLPEIRTRGNYGTEVFRLVGKRDNATIVRARRSWFQEMYFVEDYYYKLHSHTISYVINNYALEYIIQQVQRTRRETYD